MQNIELAYLDDLTGLYNRRFYRENFAASTAKAQIENQEVSLILIDVDHFKGFNDNFGHEQGDAVLVLVSEAIRKAAGEDGKAIRYGGDEFAILFEGLGRNAARERAEALRQEVAAIPFKLPDQETPHTITLSVGVTGFPADTQEPGKLFELADECVYLSKKKGRNAVSTLEESIPKTLDVNNLHHYFPCRTFVGRDSLMDSIKPLFSPAPLPKRPVTLIEGPAGIGKSRLLQEIYGKVDQQRCYALEFRSFPHLMEQPFVELTAGLTVILSSSPELQAKIAGQLDTYSLMELTHFFPFLAGYLPFDMELQAVSVEKRKQLLLDAFTQILLILAKEKPVILCLDDMHWANMGTIMVLERVKLQPAGKDIAIFSAFNPEEALKSLMEMAESYFKRLTAAGLMRRESLAPLTPEDCSLMLEAILPGLTRHEDFLAILREKSKGNPGYVEAGLKLLVHKGKLGFQDNQLQLLPVQAEDFPDSLNEALKPQVLALDDEVRSVLSHAASMGNKFNLASLQKLEGKNEGYLLDILDKARRASLITSEEGSEEYQFQEAATGTSLIELLEPEEKETLRRKIRQVQQEFKDKAFTDTFKELGRHLKLQLNDAMEAVRELFSNYSEFVSPAVVGIYVGALPEKGEALPQEKILTPAEEAQAVRVAKLIRMSLKNIGVFPPESEIVQGSLYSLFCELEQIFTSSPVLAFAESDGNVLINGKAVAWSHYKDNCQETISEILARASLKAIAFRKGLQLEELQHFFSLVLSHNLAKQAAQTGWAKLLTQHHIFNILVDEKIYVAFGSREVVESQVLKRDTIKVIEGGSEAAATAGAALKSEVSLPADIREKLDSLRQELSGLHTVQAQMERIEGFLEMVMQARQSWETAEARPGDDQSQARESAAAEAQTEAQAPAHAPEADIPEDPEAQAIRKRLEEIKSHIDSLALDTLDQDLDILIKDLESEEKTLVDAAALALYKYGEESISPLVRFIKSSDALLGRKVALHILKRLDPQADFTLMDEIMSSTLAEEQVRLLEALHDFRQIDITGYIGLLLRSPSQDVRRAVLALLERRGGDKAATLLIGLLKESDEDYVIDVINSLGKLKAREAVTPLCDLVRKHWFFEKHIREDVQEAACLSLGEIGDTAAIPCLISALKFEGTFLIKRLKQSSVRAAAAYALAHFPTERVTRILTQASKSMDSRVRSAASLALQIIASPEAHTQDRFDRLLLDR